MKAVSVKISNELADSARQVAQLSDRSLAGQIEHWAKLGKSVESVLSGESTIALKKSGQNAKNARYDARPGESAQEILTSLRKAMPYGVVREGLTATHRVLYEADPDHPGGLIRVSPDGARIPGRMVDRTFVATD